MITKIDPTNLREIVWELINANEKLTDTIALQNDRIFILEQSAERQATLILDLTGILNQMVNKK